MRFQVVIIEKLIGMRIEYDGFKISTDWLTEMEREELATQMEEAAKTLRAGGEKWVSTEK